MRSSFSPNCRSAASCAWSPMFLLKRFRISVQKWMVSVHRAVGAAAWWRSDLQPRATVPTHASAMAFACGSCPAVVECQAGMLHKDLCEISRFISGRS